MFLAWVITENTARGLAERERNDELVLLRFLCSIHVTIGARGIK